MDMDMDMDMDMKVRNRKMRDSAAHRAEIFDEESVPEVL